jgi:NAD(P)-dependent dehydrogenase (short-subunit alcohol dehydrogenase family)
MNKEQKPFHNDLVVVTGAGSGIGRATTLGFAANGARLVAADVDLAAATSVCELIRERGGQAHARQVDVADPAGMDRFAGWVRAELGVPDVVVNNAGIAIIGPFLAHTEEDWQRIIGINLLGVVRGCRVFGAQMAERGQGGHLVNIASAAAYTPATLLPAYATTKAAVRMLSECLRAELAGDGIGVTAICPGFTNTPIARSARLVGVPAADEEQVRESLVRALRRRRFPPQKVARAVMLAVLRDRALVPVNAEARAAYALSLAAPGALRALARQGARRSPLRLWKARDSLLARHLRGVEQPGEHRVVAHQHRELHQRGVVVGLAERVPGGLADGVLAEQFPGGVQQCAVMARPVAGRGVGDAGYLLIAQSRPAREPLVLPPLVLAAAQPRGPQDDQFPVARGQHAGQQQPGAQREEVAQQVRMPGQGQKDVQGRPAPAAQGVQERLNLIRVAVRRGKRDTRLSHVTSGETGPS